MTTDVCRFCHCTERDPCVVDGLACAWADRTRTVCTVCAPAALAEHIFLRALRAAGYFSREPGITSTLLFVDAFHLGYVVGWFQVSRRSIYGRNPYRTARVREAWALGIGAGAEASRQYVRLVGRLPNRPRPTALRRVGPR